MKTETISIRAVDFFQRLADEKNVCFLKSSTPEGWQTLIAFNPAARFCRRAGNRSGFKAFVNRNAARGRKLIGYISYDIGYGLYRLQKKAKDDLELPDICFYAFDNYLVFKGGLAEIHCADPKFIQTAAGIAAREPAPPPRARHRNFRPAITQKQYERAYRKIKKYIFDGEIYQINFTHRLEGRSGLPARSLFVRVIDKNPVDFLGYIEGDGFEILSASPERFLKITNRKVETCPIKGTRPRGRTPQSDERYRRQLLENKKEAAELNMITDLLRNDLGKVCEIGSVKVAGSQLLSRCPTVWHTYSKITGRVLEGISPVEALVSMLPGGSITGCPKKRAMEIIDELEPTTRSVYTGVIGTIDPKLNLDFSIAIRTIIRKQARLYLQVGGGIVYDSVEKAEFRETLDKARSFMQILV